MVIGDKNKIKLFCIPYAGGAASVFYDWEPFLPPYIELRPIELAGKGSRIKEALYGNMSEAVEDVFRIIREEILDGPYMLLGHSMGSKIAYKLALKIQEERLRSPLHIFLSGSSAPHFRREDEEIFHLMEDELFKRKVLALGGTPRELFEHPELFELFIPALKNDFKLIETADYGKDIEQISIDLSVFLGKEDDLTLLEQEGWKKYTNRECNIFYFEGGHFYFLDKLKDVTSLINEIIDRSIRVIDVR